MFRRIKYWWQGYRIVDVSLADEQKLRHLVIRKARYTRFTWFAYCVRCGSAAVRAKSGRLTGTTRLVCKDCGCRMTVWHARGWFIGGDEWHGEGSHEKITCLAFDVAETLLGEERAFEMGLARVERCG